MTKAIYTSGDDTRNWVENWKQDGLVKPNMLVRFATDTNYLYNNSDNIVVVSNLALPGQRVPGCFSLQVQESAQQSVSTASIDILNALPVSTTATTLTNDLEGKPFSSTIVNQWVTNSLGSVDKLGAVDISNTTDPFGIYYREENVVYRTRANQSFTVASATGFPDPSVPDDDDGNDVSTVETWRITSTGVGAYFVLIDEEVIRLVSRRTVSGHITYEIPPGGRGIGNTDIVTHSSGAPVTLLGYGPATGEVVGIGYLNVDDWKPQTCMLRPGTCLVTYEGYGNITGPMRHKYDPTSNYVFTGFWIVSGVEPSIQEDNVPHIRVDLKSAGYMFEQQKITPDILRRAKTQFGQWKIGQDTADAGGETIWGSAGHNRNIPGDWVDFNSWDPSLMGSYPMKVSIELAQHKDFFDHMTQTNFGALCEICLQEDAEWKKTHTVSKDTALAEQRAVGKHIYKESIRVLRTEAGPIKTYIRLMATLAMAAWDHPVYGTELSQAFTKIPNELFDNLRNIYTGLIFNGQIALDVEGEPDHDWSAPTYDDSVVLSNRIALTCPYQSTYDKTPFSQPMHDLADVNGMNFWVNRQGYPVLKPKLFTYRPSGHGFTDLSKTQHYDSEPNGQWFQAYGASISGYSNNVDASNLITQCWITGTTAFQSQLTVMAGGTGIVPNVKTDTFVRKNFSSLGGNRIGLSLTSGVQQVDTQNPDSLVLGLDWNTNAAAWGAVQSTPDGTKILNALPPLYDGSPPVNKDNWQRYKVATKRIQLLVKWFVARSYLGTPADISNVGEWKADTTNGVKALQTYLKGLFGDPYSIIIDGEYRRRDYLAVKHFLSTEQNYIQLDIFWYMQHNYPWEAYLSAITGLPIKFVRNKASKTSQNDLSYAVDDRGTQKEVATWTKTFARALVNMGNRVVDDSINQAIVRTISSNMADPRIQPGDIIWANVPGYQNVQKRAPATNGVYVLTISRTLDLQNASYQATYSGHRYIGLLSTSEGTKVQEDINAGYNFLTGDA